MSKQSIKVVYWVLTILFGLAMLMDGGAGIAKEQTGQDVMKHLGMPVYIMIITSAFKIAGAVALLQNRYYTIKEWAFAGFFINFTGAIASRVFVGDSIGLLVPPLVMFLIMFTLYYFWKNYNQLTKAQKL
ncbi:DoxX family protein [Mucilaginibacter litoreus]|uniref:DoxX family protein n=1 Tax=Mucilaginibacter litoreus TaxID=1048221 RepID=A0ABW3AW89_9SPHI